MTILEEDVRPIALVVDDNPNILEQRQELFREFGFKTVGAEDYSTALAKFRSTPGVSLLATDINLNPKEDDNRDGYRLAEDVHSIVPSLPMVALSGVVSEESFRRSRRAALFRDSFIKAEGWDKLRGKLPVWRTWAIDYLESRITAAEGELLRLKAKYGISDYDFALMHEFLPLPLESASDLDNLILAKGYRLRIIETTGVPDECEREGVRILKSIPLWVRTDEQQCTVELYGFPQIYTGGASEDAAVQQILFLMHGYFQDSKATPPDQEDSPLVAQLRHYLESVFSPD